MSTDTTAAPSPPMLSDLGAQKLTQDFNKYKLPAGLGILGATALSGLLTATRPRHPGETRRRRTDRILRNMMRTGLATTGGVAAIAGGRALNEMLHASDKPLTRNNEGLIIAEHPNYTLEESLRIAGPHIGTAVGGAIAPNVAGRILTRAVDNPLADAANANFNTFLKNTGSMNTSTGQLLSSNSELRQSPHFIQQGTPLTASLRSVDRHITQIGKLNDTLNREITSRNNRPVHLAQSNPYGSLRTAQMLQREVNELRTSLDALKGSPGGIPKSLQPYIKTIEAQLKTLNEGLTPAHSARNTGVSRAAMKKHRLRNHILPVGGAARRLRSWPVTLMGGAVGSTVPWWFSGNAEQSYPSAH